MIEVGQDGPQDATHHAHAHLIGSGLESQEDAVEGVDEIGGVEQVVLDHVLGGLGLVEDGGEVGLSGHLQHVPPVDVQVVLADLLADEAPIYYRGYVPEEICLLLLLEGDGEVLVQFLLRVAPGDHCALLPLEVAGQAHARAQEQAFGLAEDFDVVEGLFFEFIGGDLQVSMSAEFVLSGGVVGDHVDLDGGLKVFQGEVALRVHLSSFNMFINLPI